MKTLPTREPAAKPSSFGRFIRRTIAVGSWLALATVVVAWIWLQFGDDWWPATLIMFLPRWIWALFPALMLVVSILGHRPSLLPATAAIGLALGPVMGLCIPWRPLVDAPPERGKLRVFTCNMHYGKTDPRLLDSLIEETHPNVIALQEWRSRNSDHSKLVESGKWYVDRQEGLFLASRFQIVKVHRLGPDSSSPHGSAMRYEILTPEGVVSIISLHLESPRDGLGQVAGTRLKNNDGILANSERRAQQSLFLAAQAARISGPLLVVGDFNTPPESVFFDNIWTGYRDAFNDAGLGWGYTFFNRATSVRIDHILIGNGGRASQCWVGRNVGSPHRPVIADVSWPLRGAQ